jgi:hypothetical protein
MAHRGTHSSATGPAPNTAGPHKSDLLNKLDPRVDSDLSESRGTTGTTGTTGRHTTTGTTGHTTTGTGAAVLAALTEPATLPKVHTDPTHREWLTQLILASTPTATGAELLVVPLVPTVAPTLVSPAVYPEPPTVVYMVVYPEAHTKVSPAVYPEPPIVVYMVVYQELHAKVSSETFPEPPSRQARIALTLPTSWILLSTALLAAVPCKDGISM